MIFQGEEGVREVLQILNDEFRLSMALSGESQMLLDNWITILKYACAKISTSIFYCMSSETTITFYLIQVVETWLKSTGTSSNSLDSKLPAEGSTEDNNGIH